MLDARRARTAWLHGARAFHHGNRSVAADEFEHAVLLDEGMADAWLGMHAVGRQPLDAVAAMAKHENRFGEERRRANVTLKSRFDVGPFISQQLESHLELWCAVAAGHMRRNEFAHALSAIKRTSDGSMLGRYMRGWHAFEVDDGDQAIRWLRSVITHGDRFLQASARFLSGVALTEAGAIGPAREYFNWILRADFLPEAHASARYWLAMIAREEGDEEAALDYLHRAFAQDPSHPGVKAAMAKAESAIKLKAARADAADTAPGEDADNPAETPTSADPDEAPETVEDVLAELDEQIGQPQIKHQVRSLLANTRAQIARRDQGLQQTRLTKHFIFTGPPGTGKTTIARVIARLYKALGVLDGGQLVEVDRSGLIGEFHGHTVAKTQEKLTEAMGGVLLIDEAYALKTEGFAHGDPFGQEAIDTILKRMEDDRDQFIVIAAGYPGPMERFLNSNPGLKSRFTATVNFTPYDASELVEIAELMARNGGDHLTAEARVALEGLLTAMQARGDFESESFGNARFVRTLIEQAAECRNLRVFGDSHSEPPTRDAMTQITGADIEQAHSGVDA